MPPNYSPGRMNEVVIDIATTLRRIASAVSAALAVESFEGDNSTTAFTLSHIPVAAVPETVVLGGAQQFPPVYTIVNNQLVFAEAPPLGMEIWIRYGYTA